jgi:uncharacterized protein
MDGFRDWSLRLFVTILPDMRTLLLIAAIVIVFMLVRSLLLQSKRKRSMSGGNKRESLKQQGDIVRCAHCGVHIPQSEALTQIGKHYCSQEHADADQSEKRSGPFS